MSLRRKAPQDSLYLLLDTLCNAFGGIILLAVLVVLLTSKEKSQTAKASESSDVAQRRLATAEANLQQSAQLASALQAKAGDERWKQQIALLATRKDLQDTIQQLQAAITENSKELETSSVADPSERLKFLNSQMASAQARGADATNRLAATEEENKHLKQRLADLRKQLAARQADSERQLRLPKEHDPGKRVMYVVVRYGRLYPCHYADMSENDNDIKWTKAGLEQKAEPIPGKGYDADGITAYYRQLSGGEVYLVFCVFEDSFPAFIHAKALALSEGISCGWDPFRYAEGPVTFSPFGSTPGAQ